MTGLAGLRIPSDYLKPCLPIAIARGQLTELQKIVGGYIEVVPCGRLQLIVNEDGISKDLPLNHRATALHQLHQADRVQFLRGDAFLVGPTTPDGEFAPLDPEVARLIGEAFDGLIDFAVVKSAVA